MRLLWPLSGRIYTHPDVQFRQATSLYRTAFDAGLYQPDGFQTEMACRTNQLGSIVTTSRETLDEGKVRKYEVIEPFFVDKSEGL